MAVKIRAADISDQMQIIQLLQQFSNDGELHWKKIFRPRPWQDNNDIGYVIEDENKIVGFLGTIFSTHQLGNHTFNICNFTSWYVHPNYRQHGLMLFLKIMKIPNISWTNLTPAPHIVEWLKKSGFKVLEDKKVLVFPLLKLFSKKSINISLGENINTTFLSKPLKKLHQQYEMFPCERVWLSRGDTGCYVLIVKSSYKKIPIAKIYYVSDKDWFNAHLANFRLNLCLKLRVFYLQIEGQLFTQKQLFGIKLKDMNPPRLFKSSTLSKDDISLLGSELLVLGI